jgi:DNA topoisomerase-1
VTTALERLQKTGIRRLGSPTRGFRYRLAEGGPVTAAQRQRIEALVLPPAWTEVRISPSPGNLLQAIGRDRAGRWQYRYGAAQERRREERKRRRLLLFLEALPKLRARVARDLRRPGLPRERVLAGAVRILMQGYLRPGSRVYARDNGSFGLATLRRGHAKLAGDTLTLQFPGKSRKVQTRTLTDPRLARMVRRLLREPGRQLLRYRTDGGAVDVRRRHINEYLKEVGGGGFTAKDFRTWAGTVLAAGALARVGLPEPLSRRAVAARVTAAMRETARELGNTPAVCRTSYVCREVIEAFEEGRLLSEPLPDAGLSGAPARVFSSVEGRLRRELRAGRRPVRPRSG